MGAESRKPFLVLVTGHAGAGKSTLAPRIADSLDAVCISRDAIHSRVFDGWEPSHPATLAQYDPEVDGNTFKEGKVNWSIFLWMIEQVVPKVPVVAETPFNHDWNRTMFAEVRARLAVPIVEVALVGDPVVLLDRVRRRAAQPDAHTIKARFSVTAAESLLQRPFQPVMDAARVLEVDTTDLDAVSADQIASAVERIVATQ